MRKYFLFVMLVGLVSGCPAYAKDGDPSAESRYHDAYVLEVVEGKIADAARVYLALLRDDGTPARLRHESKFRFAVCAVLLGRSDEARGYLDQLLRDKDVPESVRTRAEAYRKAVSGIGLGSELDKKLQELVFELAKAKVAGSPPVYRDFEILSDQAVPFLRKLLQHRDKILRYHAFRLLLRMDEPDLIDVWNPDMMISPWLWADFTPYLIRRPEARTKLEKRFLAGELSSLRQLSEAFQVPAFSPAFLEVFLERTKDVHTAVRMVRAPVTEARDALLAKWTGAGGRLGAEALDAVARHAWQRPIADDAMFVRAVELVIQELQNSKHTENLDVNLPNMWPTMRSAEAVVTGLERLVEAARTWSGKRELHPLFGDRDDHAIDLLLSLRERKLTADTQERLAKVLRAWILLIQPYYTEDGIKPRRNYDSMVEILTRIVRPLMGKMPQADAEDFVGWLFKGPAHESPAAWSPLFKPPHTERSLKLTFLAATKVAAGSRWDVLENLPVAATPTVPVASRDAQIEAMLALLPDLESTNVYKVAGVIARVAATLEPQAREQLLERALAYGEAMDTKRRTSLQRNLLTAQGSTEYVVAVGIAFAEARWDSLETKAQETLLAWAVHKAPDRATSAEQRDVLRAFVRRHRTELSDHLLDRVAQKDELILRYEDWIPLVRARMLQHAGSNLGQAMVRLKEERADEVAAALFADKGTQINEAIIAFVLSQTSYEIRAGYADRLLKIQDPKLRAFTLGLLHHTHGKPATADGLEAALASELARVPTDEGLLYVIANRLLNRRPSEKLIPAARRLLKAKDPRHVLFGATMAGSLGSATLQPDLQALLNSMNANIRRAVTQALGEIHNLSQLRGDAK